MENKYVYEEPFVDNWALFLAPYGQAVEELKLKLKSIRQEYIDLDRHAPIEFVTGRVKSPESIMEKMAVRQIKAKDFLCGVQDIAGVRVMCQFVEDIYEVADLLLRRSDFKVIMIRDYIKNHKPSGYRSYHMILEYPVERIEGNISVIVEVQIRTLAMNFWATIEHSLNYKYDGKYPVEILERLQRASEAAFLLDEEMSQIREEIHEATKLFDSR
ncbi:GTP pyrophosphokinase [Facklamia sp. P12945]|uniref:GTP pyrophosphokinase n=1 Tax=unclassified Facklamia TaxID=2622293 RepID=UPI003D17F4F4